MSVAQNTFLTCSNDRLKNGDEDDDVVVDEGI